MITHALVFGLGAIAGWLVTLANHRKAAKLQRKASAELVDLKDRIQAELDKRR